MNIQTIQSFIHIYIYGTCMRLIYCISIYICNHMRLTYFSEFETICAQFETYKATHIVTKPCETTFIHIYFIIKSICNIMWQYGMICTRMQPFATVYYNIILAEMVKFISITNTHLLCYFLYFLQLLSILVIQQEKKGANSLA